VVFCCLLAHTFGESTLKVTPIVPVILIPKKTDKVQNDPERRKIKKREKK